MTVGEKPPSYEPPKFANKEQVGGDHYKHPGHEEHWDRAYRLKYDCFQYIITKWVERWRDKGGIEDLYKVRHAINKYIEVAEMEESIVAAKKIGAGPEYVDQ